MTYHFIDETKWNEMVQRNEFVETREYDTVAGVWKYGTSVGELSKDGDILAIGTLVSYKSLLEYSLEKEIVPIYVCCNDDIIRDRAIKRSGDNLDEVKRRIEADKIDFSDDKVESAGITDNNTFYNNGELSDCLIQIKNYIRKGGEK